MGNGCRERAQVGLLEGGMLSAVCGGEVGLVE